MQVISIILGILLAGTCCLLGRVCHVNKRLHSINNKKSEVIADLKAALVKATDDMTATLHEIQNPLPLHPHTFAVKPLSETFEEVFVVYMTTSVPDGYIDVPVKTFCDLDDPDFGRREAEEFKEKCEETI